MPAAYGEQTQPDSSHLSKENDIVCESDGTDGMGERYEKLIEGMKVYKANEIESALHSAGFKDIKTIHHDKHPWIAVLAKK